MDEEKKAFATFVAARDQIMTVFREHENDLVRIVENGPAPGDEGLIATACDFCLAEYFMQAEWKLSGNGDTTTN